MDGDADTAEISTRYVISARKYIHITKKKIGWFIHIVAVTLTMDALTEEYGDVFKRIDLRN